jgi:DNA-binding CsgD family transcriptional regulator
MKLTKREFEVLTLLAQGLTSGQVANELYVSKRTVDFHIANLYDKLQVPHRVAMVAWFHANGSTVTVSA